MIYVNKLINKMINKMINQMNNQLINKSIMKLILRPPRSSSMWIRLNSTQSTPTATTPPRIRAARSRHRRNDLDSVFEDRPIHRSRTRRTTPSPTSWSRSPQNEFSRNGALRLRVQPLRTASSNRCPRDALSSTAAQPCAASASRPWHGWPRRSRRTARRESQSCGMNDNRSGLEAAK